MRYWLWNYFEKNKGITRKKKKKEGVGGYIGKVWIIDTNRSKYCKWSSTTKFFFNHHA